MDPSELLGVRELKEALRVNGIPMQGLVEKKDLIDALDMAGAEVLTGVSLPKLKQFIQSHGFSLKPCGQDKNEFVLRAANVRVIALKQQGAEAMRQDLEYVDAVFERNLHSSYDILGLKSPHRTKISEKEIQIAYRALIRTVHPDKNRAQGAKQAASLVNEAYDKLKETASPACNMRSNESSTPAKDEKQRRRDEEERRHRREEKEWWQHFEEEQRRRSQEEAKRKEKERQRRREEKQRRKQQEAEEQRRREEEERRRKMEEEKKREAEQRRREGAKRREEEEHRRKIEEEKKREAEQRRREEARRKEEEHRRKIEEEKKREAEQRRREEARRKEEEEHRRKRVEELLRKLEEEDRRREEAERKMERESEELQRRILEQMKEGPAKQGSNLFSEGRHKPDAPNAETPSFQKRSGHSHRRTRGVYATPTGSNVSKESNGAFRFTSDANANEDSAHFVFGETKIPETSFASSPPVMSQTESKTASEERRKISTNGVSGFVFGQTPNNSSTATSSNSLPKDEIPKRTGVSEFGDPRATSPVTHDQSKPAGNHDTFVFGAGTSAKPNQLKPEWKVDGFVFGGGSQAATPSDQSFVFGGRSSIASPVAPGQSKGVGGVDGFVFGRGSPLKTSDPSFIFGRAVPPRTPDESKAKGNHDGSVFGGNRPVDSQSKDSGNRNVFIFGKTGAKAPPVTSEQSKSNGFVAGTTSFSAAPATPAQSTGKGNMGVDQSPVNSRTPSFIFGPATSSPDGNQPRTTAEARRTSSSSKRRGVKPVRWKDVCVAFGEMNVSTVQYNDEMYDDL